MKKLFFILRKNGDYAVDYFISLWRRKEFINRNMQHRWHVKMLLMYIGIIFGVIAIHSRDIQILGFSVHNFCLIKTLFGIECPVCGVTRSVLNTMHFNFSRAFLYHPLGPLITFLIILNFIYFLLTVLFKKMIKIKWDKEVKLFSKVDTILITLLIVSWILKLIVSWILKIF